MPSFAQVLTFAALAVAASATAINPILERAANQGHHCPDGRVANSASVEVNGKTVTLTSFQCGSNAPATTHRRRSLFDEPPLCILFGTCKPKPSKTATATPTPTATPKNVCGVTCSKSCNTNAGNLPPTTEDCDQVENAIQIFQQQINTFVVEPSHLQTLTFNTCSYFFHNTGSRQLEYCWHDLAVTGSASGSACFPPVQPLNSEGLCTAGDGSWAVGAAHS